MAWSVEQELQRSNMHQVVHTNDINTNQIFGMGEFSSLIYHDLFDYPLTFKDMIRWKTGSSIKPLITEAVIVQHDGYYFLEGKKPRYRVI